MTAFHGLGDALTVILENALAPFSRYYRRDGVEEIMVNDPGRVWLKTGANSWECVMDPDISEDAMMAACQVLAARTNRTFDVDHSPLLYCETKPEGYRWSSIMGRHCLFRVSDERGMALCVRKTRTEARKVTDFLGSEGARTRVSDLAGASAETRRRVRYSEFVEEDLMMAVEQDGAVAVSGGTGTGKSNLSMAMIEMIPRDRRVITIEDSVELLVPHENRLHLIVDRLDRAESGLTWATMVDFLRRASPDVILPGEISGKNAAAFISLFNSGHNNCMTTVHANSVAGCVRAIFMNVANVLPSANFETIAEMILQSFSRFVHIEKTGDVRRIVELALPHEIDIFASATARSEVREDFQAFQRHARDKGVQDAAAF